MTGRAKGSTRWMGWTVLLAGVVGGVVAAEPESRFAATHSRSQYVHWIDLYDAKDHKIDPADPNAPPYSPMYTCGRCHDYLTIAHGFHFNARDKEADAGRPGEPWIWTDNRTGTQIPLSYRGWAGTYDPRKLGISEWEFVLQFGRHLPGGGPGEPFESPAPQPATDGAAPAAEGGEAAAAETPAAKEGEKKSEPPAAAPDGLSGRWKISGQLSVDCMICHSNDAGYSPEFWRDQIAKQNLAWAATAALGLGAIEGEASGLPDDFDPAAAPQEGGPKLPKTTYTLPRVNGEKKVLFDIVRTPSDNACFYCHTTRVVGKDAGPDWTHDEDVHLRAGMTCSDCHRNGIDHHTVRGFEGERHPTGESVATLSCRGCHLDQTTAEGERPGGRLGAPKPLHRGLPPLHLDKLSCTACHSGPWPGPKALQVQTAMAHLLGLPSHDFSPANAPGMVAPVLMRDQDTLYPHRMVWPAFWGMIQGDNVTPLHPEAANEALRRTLRVRRGSTFTETMSEVKLSAEDKTKALGEERGRVPESELSAEEKAKLADVAKSKASEAFAAKLAESLQQLKKAIKEPNAEPVYISGGKAYRLDKDNKVQEFASAAAKPYAWKLGHDVRPARWSLGAEGCFDCHSVGAPIFEGRVTAIGPAPDANPPATTMYELAGYDKTKLDAWNQSFQGRTAFKYFGFAAMTVVGLVLLSYVLVGINGVFGVGRRQ